MNQGSLRPFLLHHHLTWISHGFRRRIQYTDIVIAATAVVTAIKLVYPEVYASILRFFRSPSQRRATLMSRLKDVEDSLPGLEMVLRLFVYAGVRTWACCVFPVWMPFVCLNWKFWFGWQVRVVACGCMGLGIARDREWGMHTVDLQFPSHGGWKSMVEPDEGKDIAEHLVDCFQLKFCELRRVIKSQKQIDSKGTHERQHNWVGGKKDLV